MSRRKTTEHDGLTPQQAAAVDLLAAGRNVTDTAAELGVCRQTVSGWLHGDSHFTAAYNRRRQELWAAAADRLRAMVPAALDVLAAEIEGGSTNAAVAVLKAAGLQNLPPPSGATDAAIIEFDRLNTF